VAKKGVVRGQKGLVRGQKKDWFVAQTLKKKIKKKGNFLLKGSQLFSCLLFRITEK